mmetsp:Transcript_24467/g.59350  ORF Transcript_24467/g.59350 Transcript_24467/m.59350 type:complete len:204 (-) Transcript_24467:1009-1620(-)
MHSIHLRFPILLISVSLLLHFADCIGGFLNVNLMARTFDGQSVHFFAKFQNVSLVLAQPSLHPTHTEVQCTQPSGCFGATQLSLLFDLADFLESLLLLLANVVFKPRLSVGHISLKIRSNNCDFVETVRQGILRGVQRLLRRSKILVGEINPSVQSIHSLIRVACNFCFGLLQVGFHGSDVVSNCCKDLVHLATASVHIQSQR